ncbi:hypothetical protein CHCC14559_1028 [Bacillus licheniformis]|nr:hypothetical protein CHCC14562_1776 [Bacillus licheniformis]TWN24301.1 hypothetical protein CHCC14559_1028 [Bacillus licheniformis]
MYKRVNPLMLLGFSYVHTLKIWMYFMDVWTYDFQVSKISMDVYF